MFASVFPTVAALFLPLPCPGITAAGNGTGIVADIPWDADIPAKMQTSLLFLIQVQTGKECDYASTLPFTEDIPLKRLCRKFLADLPG